MKNVRLAALALLFFCSCDANEDKLVAAHAVLVPQIRVREKALRDHEELRRFEVSLEQWRIASRDYSRRGALPTLNVSLDPVQLLPLNVPDLPPAVPLESSRVRTLRHEISEFIKRARQLDRRISEFDDYKANVRKMLTDAETVERARAELPMAKPMFDINSTADGGWDIDEFNRRVGLKTDAGTMRRLQP